MQYIHYTYCIIFDSSNGFSIYFYHFNQLDMFNLQVAYYWYICESLQYILLRAFNFSIRTMWVLTGTPPSLLDWIFQFYVIKYYLGF